MSDWLVFLDVDSIQRYIFASARLREMVGASFLVRDFNVGLRDGTLTTGLPSGRVLTMGGGAALIKCPGEDEARKLASGVRRRFEATAEGATLSCSEPVEFGPVRSFRQAMAEALESLTASKRGGRQPGDLLTAPYFVRCRSCGSEPAVAADRDNDPVGPACLAKQAARTINPFTRAQRARNWWQRKLEVASPGWNETEIPEDFNEVAGSGPLAVVVADGDGVGQRLETLLENVPADDQESVYAGFSRQFAEVADDALIDALGAALEPRNAGNGGLIPCQVLIAGGDDVTIAVEGGSALTLAEQLCRLFHNKTSSLDGGALSMSAATVITRPGFPFRRAHELAEHLLGKAKRERRTRGWPAGALHYAVITEASAEERALLADLVYGLENTGNPNEEVIHLTGRPYAVGNGSGRTTAALRTAVEEVKRDFPRSKLYDLRKMFTTVWLRQQGLRETPGHGDDVSEAVESLEREYRYWRSRVAASEQHEQRWTAVEKALNLDGTRPWFREETPLRSPVSDLAEAVDLIRE